jgi:lipoprotein-releasing system ATP-binding protein
MEAAQGEIVDLIHAPRAPWPEPGPVVITTAGLTRVLGTEVKTPVLNGIDLTVRQGEFVALTGASGSGKSTLLYLLGVLDKPTGGSVTIDGVDVNSLTEDQRAKLRREKLGFVFQFHFLLPEFTVVENVAIPILRRGKVSRGEAYKKAHDALVALGMGEYIDRRITQLSGGQQQRVSIARAVANDPRLILADEPTGNLDSKNGEIVMEIFESLTRDRGLTIIMVTHEPNFALRASRQIILRDGLIIDDLDQAGRATRPQAPAPALGDATPTADTRT